MLQWLRCSVRGTVGWLVKGAEGAADYVKSHAVAAEVFVAQFCIHFNFTKT
jgi:hypothetical protein